MLLRIYSLFYSPYLYTVNDKIKIVLADDQPLFLKWLKMILNSESNFEIISEAKDGREAVEQIITNNPDMAILDYDMPFKNGSEVAKEVLINKPDLKIVMMTVYKDAKLMKEAERIGVLAFVLKDSTDEEIVNAIRVAAKGDKCFSTEI